jgi:hypothetical protein
MTVLSKLGQREQEEALIAAVTALAKHDLDEIGGHCSTDGLRGRS